MLRRTFGPRMDEVTREWRELHNEELNDLYSSPNTVWVIKLRRVRWAGTGAGDKRKAKGALRSLWKSGCFFYTGQSKSNISYHLCHAIYKMDMWKFQGTSPQHCWKAHLYFKVVSIFADILLPPTNKGMHSHPVKVALSPLQS